MHYGIPTEITSWSIRKNQTNQNWHFSYFDAFW